MRKILIFATAYYPLIGGAEVAMKEITDRLSDSFQFDMITALLDRKLARQEKIGNINVYRVGCGARFLDKLWLALFGQLLAFKLHRQNNYQAIWSLMASYGAFSAVRFKKRTGLKFLLTLQEGDPIGYILKKVCLVSRQFKEIFRLADGLQAISNYLLNWGLSLGFKGEIKEVVPNGVDVGRFTKEFSQAEISSLKNSFGFPPAAKVIITSSRLVLKNGVGDVIKSLKHLPEYYCFYILGEGELLNDLKNLTTELDLNQRVAFGGFKNHQALPKYLKASDIFIRPSLTEGLGNSFLEAMAVGLPTIGTLVGGIPDFLTEDVTGLVCLPENPVDIARAIKKAGELTVAQKQLLHQNAMRLIKEKYNWEYISARMKFFFEILTTK